FDSTILSDPIFLSALEYQRCSKTLDYMKDNPRKLEEQLRLLTQVDPEHCKEGAKEEVAVVLTKLSLNASPQFREKVFFDEKLTETFRDFSQYDSFLQKLMGQLYAV